jgi:hypothetical protein
MCQSSEYYFIRGFIIVFDPVFDTVSAEGFPVIHSHAFNITGPDDSRFAYNMGDIFQLKYVTQYHAI